VSRISTDELNQATTHGSRRGAHGAVKAIEAVLGVTAGKTHPCVGRRVINHGGYFFLQTIISSRELRRQLGAVDSKGDQINVVRLA